MNASQYIENIAQNVENAGAVGLIIINTENSTFVIEDKSGRVNIPVVMLSSHDGKKLHGKDEYLNLPTLNRIGIMSNNHAKLEMKMATKGACGSKLLVKDEEADSSSDTPEENVVENSSLADNDGIFVKMVQTNDRLAGTLRIFTQNKLLLGLNFKTYQSMCLTFFRI